VALERFSWPGLGRRLDEALREVTAASAPGTGVAMSESPSTPPASSPVAQPEPIKLTEGAAEKIRELLAGQEDSSDQALRVAVRGGGCSGFQYALAFDRTSEDDHVFEHRGVSVAVDKASMQFVFGAEIDWVDGLQGAGFSVNNPNVVAACGCGSSFQVREDAAERAAAV
jgi:iron-sulfur cluster assembly protein